MEQSRNLDLQSAVFAASIPATGAVMTSGSMVSQIRQGVGNAYRSADVATVTSIDMRGAAFILTANATAKSYCAIRLILVRDRQPDGAVAAVTDVLYGTTAAPGTIDIQALPNIATSMRFDILWDRTFLLNPGAADYSAGGWGTILEDFNVSIKEVFPVKYGSNTGAVADVITNNVFLIGISKCDASLLPNVYVNRRVNFVC